MSAGTQRLSPTTLWPMLRRLRTSQEWIGISQPCRAPRDAGAGRERQRQSEGAAGWSRSQCIAIRKTVLFITHQNDEAVGYICVIPARL